MKTPTIGASDQQQRVRRVTTSPPPDREQQDTISRTSTPTYVRASTPQDQRHTVSSGSGALQQLRLEQPPEQTHLGANHEALTRLETEMTRLQLIIEAPAFLSRSGESRAAIRGRRDEIQERHALLSRARLDLARGSDSNTVVAAARPRRLPAGTRLFSCASPGAVRSIIRDGIRLDVGENSFGAPEMGNGLYVDTMGGTYRDGIKQILVLEVTDDLDGVSTKPLEEMRRESAFEAEEMEAGYRSLQEAHPFLQHEGLPPADTEIVLRRTSGRVRVVGVVEDAGWDVTPPTDDQITPLADYARRERIQPHESWS